MGSSERGVRTLVDILRDRARAQREQVAYTFLQDGEGQESLTYGELGQRVGAIAQRLLECCEKGDPLRVSRRARALLLFPPGLDYVAAFLACLSAGVVAVPAYPPRPNRSLERLRGVAIDAGATVMLTTPEIRGRVEQVPELLGIKILAEADWGTGVLPEIELGNLAFLQYTSGSTDAPKGVMVSHENLLHNLAAIGERFGYSAESRGVIWLPPYHDMGLIGGVLQPLYGGFPVVLMSPLMFMQSPVRWLRAIAQHQATTSGAPSFAYELCVRKIRREQIADLDLSRWQVAFNGAEPIQAEVMEQFAALLEPCGFRREAFFPCYGLAEATLMVAGKAAGTAVGTKRLRKSGLERHEAIECSAEETDCCDVVSCGKGLVDQEVRIVQPETLQVLPDQQVGEIWVSGRSVALGYWGKDGLGEAFGNGLGDEDGAFLRTGDLGFLDGDELFVTGRLKDLLIVRGRNYYPQDIEKIVKNCHSSVSLNSGVAFAVKLDEVEKVVVMQEVNRSALQNLNAAEVVGSIRQAISAYFDLQVYAILLLKPGRIPKTSSGKIQRSVCRENFLAGTVERIEHWINGASERAIDRVDEQGAAVGTEKPTALEIENWLVSHLAMYLKVQPEEIDVSQSFAYYGLDSSVAVSLTGDLAEWLHLKQLDPMLFWEYPNVEALVQHLVNLHL
jgi:acyl-CoA synthetase (AMP-forming)/AMP-acid ligase II/acyl carrier protein